MRTRILSRYLLLLLQLGFYGCEQENDPISKPSKPSSGMILTVAGSGPSAGGYEGDGGKATNAKMSWVTAVSVDKAGNIYLSDGAANTVRKVSTEGTITRFAGTFIGFNVVNPTPYYGDGGPATSAHLDTPLMVFADGAGNVFISDASNNVVRKVSDGVISTIAGTGMQGYNGDGGPATSASLFVPNGIATDAEGNVYFSDSQNNAIRMISKSTGHITTIAGLGPANAGYSGDQGPASLATLDYPLGLAMGADGNLYISDSGNNVIRKISDGVISTIAGTGGQGYSGDGSLATEGTFLSLKGIAVDAEGNVFVADAGNNAIRKIDAVTGILSTVAGTGEQGYAGDGGAATSAQLANPWGVAVDNAGNIYIADTNNSAVRMVVK
jgi:trimeric autotransporter adhesin